MVELITFNIYPANYKSPNKILSLFFSNSLVHYDKYINLDLALIQDIVKTFLIRKKPDSRYSFFLLF